jgi:hypothetical protein
MNPSTLRAIVFSILASNPGVRPLRRVTQRGSIACRVPAHRPPFMSLRRMAGLAAEFAAPLSWLPKGESEGIAFRSASTSPGSNRMHPNHRKGAAPLILGCGVIAKASFDSVCVRPQSRWLIVVGTDRTGAGRPSG